MRPGLATTKGIPMRAGVVVWGVVDMALMLLLLLLLMLAQAGVPTTLPLRETKGLGKEVELHC